MTASLKKVLITGVDGFVGYYLKSELQENGYNVFGLSQFIENKIDQIIKCDITNYNLVVEIIKNHQFDYVFHLAGFSSPSASEANPELVRRINVGGTENILDTLVKYSPHTKILVVSSSYVYGSPQYLPVDEKHPLNGSGVYAASRIEQEQMALEYARKISLIITRSFNHTGPKQSVNFIIPKIIKTAVDIKLGRQTVLVAGNVSVRRDFTDVRDVVRAYRLLLEQPRFGVICNVCRGVSISLQEVIDYIKIKAQCSIPVQISPSLVRVGEPPDIFGSNVQLKSLINWQSLVSYEEMLSSIYEYYLDVE